MPHAAHHSGHGGSHGHGRRHFFGHGRGPWWGGSSGDDSDDTDSQTIQNAQACLAQIVGSWVPQSGTLGHATRHAIRIFQAQQQLPSTGSLDQDTLSALDQACPGNSSSSSPSHGSGKKSREIFAESAPMIGEVSTPPPATGKLPTSYTPQQVIDTRYTQAVQRHDKAMWEVHPITIPFDSNFDQFAASVAYALRDKLYYRHDGGKNARGLVRATADLQVIHRLYATGSPPPAKGTPIQLNAIFGRRQDPQANMRWVMVIRFNDSHGWGFVDVKDPDVIVADPRNAQRKGMLEVLTLARMDCMSLPANNFRSKRICEMVGIAERLQYPRNWDLWYYERSLVDEYVNWRTGNARRKAMTQATGGKLPFDGQIAFPPAEWRIYPFRQAAIRCAKAGADCKAIVHNTLVHAEDEMLRTFQDMQKMFSVDSAAVFGPLVEEFRKHMVDLLNSPDSLYSVFKKFPK